MTSWDMLREMDSLRRDFNEAFRTAGFNSPMGSSFLAPLTTRRFPPVNFSEDDNSLYVEALVTGVIPREINLSVMRNTITLEGERKAFPDQEGQIVHRNELGSGKFSRTLELPVDINSEKVCAECKDGIMLITLAKAEHAKPKRIEIKLS